MSTGWVKELPIAVTVTDKIGNIIEMNDSSVHIFYPMMQQRLAGQRLLP